MRLVFIIGACVYSEINVDERITEIIRLNGFDSNKFEYKSSANFTREPAKANVRNGLKSLLFNSCKLGIVILPRDKREELGFECIKAVKQFINKNKSLNGPINVFLDQGMFNSKGKAQRLIDQLNFSDTTFFLEQNSLEVKGIQLADLAAHISAIQLKDALGLVIKTVKAGENSGYDPDLDIELGFEMWAALRYTFFNEGSKSFLDDPVGDSTFKVEPYGLYISEFCDEKLTNISREKFAEVYLGCIH